MPGPIIVATDFSDATDVVVQHAMTAARASGADVVLIHVAEIPDTPIGLPDAMVPAAGEFRRILLERLEVAREKLEEMRQRYSGQGPTITHGVKEGFPDAALASVAEELNASMVVAGTHNRTGFERFWLGSVSRKLVRVCDRDVLVARPPKPHVGGYRNVLVATSLDTSSDHLLDRVQAMVADDGTVELFHCVDVGPSYGMGSLLGAATDLVDALMEKSKADLDKVAADAKARGMNVTCELVRGRATQSIVDRLDAGDYDLAIVGSHGRRGVQRALLGSVAEGVVLGAPCAVMVVKS